MEETQEHLKEANRLQMMQNFGVLSYPVVKMVSILKLKGEGKEAFEKEFNDLNSVLRQNYEEGKDYGQYVMDYKLFEMARSGDLQAMEKLEIRKIKMENFDALQNKKK